MWLVLAWLPEPADSQAGGACAGVSPLPLLAFPGCFVARELGGQQPVGHCLVMGWLYACKVTCLGLGLLFVVFVNVGLGTSLAAAGPAVRLSSPWPSVVSLVYTLVVPQAQGLGIAVGRAILCLGSGIGEGLKPLHSSRVDALGSCVVEQAWWGPPGYPLCCSICLVPCGWVAGRVAPPWDASNGWSRLLGCACELPHAARVEWMVGNKAIDYGYGLCECLWLYYSHIIYVAMQPGWFSRLCCRAACARLAVGETQSRHRHRKREGKCKTAQFTPLIASHANKLASSSSSRAE